MENEENSYCRLCADLKHNSDLTNLEIDIEKRQDIVNKLARFNITLIFNNDMPKTVCSECLNNLNQAFDFVTTVDQAQEAFTDYVDMQKDETISEDDNNDLNLEVRSHEDDYSDNDMSIKRETDSNHDNSFKGESDINSDKDTESEDTIFKPKQKIQNTNLLKKSIPRRKLRKPQNLEGIEFCESWNEYVWTCSCCTKQFESADRLQLHSMQFHSTCNSYTCYDCSMSCLSLDKFIAHICKHRPLLILTCHKCSQKCSTMREMKIHNTTHLNSDNVCTGCNSTFSNPEELYQHMDMFYKDMDSRPIEIENKSLTCVVCQKTLKNMIQLNKHLLIHMERKRDHVCETCGKTFYNKQALAQHVIIHSDERPYKCEVCEYSFKLISELRKHLSVHFGPKSFACDKCGKCFRQKKSLTLHSAIHSDERPHVCTFCQKSFRFNNLLTQHLRLHTGDKPYSCNICPRDFRNWQNYNKHMKGQHGINNSKRRHISDGLLALDPKEDKVLKLKNKMWKTGKQGRPKKNESANKCKKDLSNNS